MVKSMTGYGGAKGCAEGLSLSIELKSVNNRYLDVSVKLPRSFLFAEELIKAAVGRHISRGKVDVFVSVDSSASDDMVVRVNEPLLRGYMDALGAVRADLLLERDGASYRVPVSEVLYAERVLRKTRVVTTRGDFMTQRTPAQLLEESRGFIRCHQSYWVNLSRIRCIRDGAFVMESGGCVPISRTYQHPAREAFFRSLVDGEK